MYTCYPTPIWGRGQLKMIAKKYLPLPKNKERKEKSKEERRERSSLCPSLIPFEDFDKAH